MPDADETEVTEQSGESTTNEPDNDEPNVTPDNGHPDDEPDENAETFPRSYVEKLRKESQGYRERAKDAETRADDLARQLFRLRVDATGKLADPDDLPYDPELLG